MAAVVCMGLVSLDGYIADADGNFEWAVPDEEVHTFINEVERPVGTSLYGRRMYEVLKVWDTWDVTAEPRAIQDYASIWRATDKIVYSSQLSPDDVTTSNTRLERDFDPQVARTIADETGRDVSISGPGLAAAAIRAGVVDEYHLLVFPVLVGGGTRFFPDNAYLALELTDRREFANGVIYLRYTARRPS
jgi:dihydrofolate reductase